MMTIKRLGLAGALASTLAFGGCSSTNEMVGRNEQTWTLHAQGNPAPGSSMPAARGKVEVATGDKGNRDLKVEAKNLLPPDTAFPGASTYVVWLKPEDGHPVNIGVLMPDKKLNAELDTKTPFTTFQIMVTAENNAQPMQPSVNQVLSAEIVVAT
jgi:hypothetical protein